MDFNNFCKVTEKADAHLVFCERFDGNSNIWNFTCHNHPYLELMYFLDGKANINIQNEKMNVSLFDAIIYPRYMFHQESLISNKRHEVIALWIDAPEIVLDSSIHVCDSNGQLRWLFESIHMESKNSNLCPSLLSNYIKALLILIVRNSIASSNNDSIEKIRQYIHNNFSEKITISQLAEIDHCSESYLSRRFKQLTGTTIVKYINKTRINAATHILVTSNASIEQVSYLAGFDSPKYFCKVFKEATGLSPREFRTSFLNNDLK